jgi:2-hydroxy-6-oxonona-2,4-dienedioate hydrolase
VNEIRYRDAEARLWKSVGMMTPTERRVDLERTRVNVRVQEVGEGPPVVFVHGATNGGTSWAPLVARLGAFHCVLLDRPGCGLSDPLASRFDDFEELGEFADSLVVDVLDALGYERADVVATSLGGYIALRSAAAHPDRIGRQLQFGCPAGANRLPLAMRLTTVPIIGRLATKAPLNERTVRAMLRRIGLREALERGRFSQPALDWYLALLRDTDTLRNELDTGPRFPLFGTADLRLLPESLLTEVHSPVCFLWGDGDPFGGPAEAGRFVARLPDAELEILTGAGHAVWMDEPEHAAATTRRFLGG